MTVSKELFLSILAMDSYNRAYNAGLADGLGPKDENGNDTDGLGRLNSILGTATVIADAQDVEGIAQAASFYAVAYRVEAGAWEGLTQATTVISYRGTDEPFTELLSIDYAIARIDSFAEDQVHLASQFYNAVRESGAENITLTGHSLGGALAGFIGGIPPQGLQVANDKTFENRLAA